MLVLAVISLIASALITLVQAQLPAAEREEFWDNELKLDDPSVGHPNVYLNIPEPIKAESRAIHDFLVHRNLTQVIERAPELLASLGKLIAQPLIRPKPNGAASSLDDEQEILLLVQTICMFKIKAEAMVAKYFEALIDATKFIDYCTSRQGKCVTTQPFERVAKQIGDFALAGKYPAEIFGLSEEKEKGLTVEARLKARLDEIVALLESALNSVKNREQELNIKLMHNLAVRLYQQLLPPKEPAFRMKIDLPDEDFFDDILEMPREAIEEKRASGRCFEALRDISKFISDCTDQENGKYFCSQADEAKELQAAIKKDIDTLIGAVYSGRMQKSSIEIKLEQMEARRILHPDKNVDLNPEQRRFMSDMFVEVEEFYNHLKTRPKH